MIKNIAYFHKILLICSKMKFAYEWKKLEAIILKEAIQTQKNKQ